MQVDNLILDKEVAKAVLQCVGNTEIEMRHVLTTGTLRQAFSVFTYLQCGQGFKKLQCN